MVKKKKEKKSIYKITSIRRISVFRSEHHLRVLIHNHIYAQRTRTLYKEIDDDIAANPFDLSLSKIVCADDNNTHP